MEPLSDVINARYHTMRAAIYRVFGDSLETAGGPRRDKNDAIPATHGITGAGEDAGKRTGALPARAGPYRILMVDDEPDLLETLKDYLEEEFENLRVSTTSSGEEALRLMQSERFDLIITDYRMPGMDGFELLTRAERLAPQIPRILITGHAVDVPSLTTELFRVNHFLSKPVRASDVVAAVRSELGQPR